MAEQHGYSTPTIPVATPTLSEVLASLDFAPKSVYMTTTHALSLIRESGHRVEATNINHGICRLQKSEAFEGVICPPDGGGIARKGFCVSSREENMGNMTAIVSARI